ncbi:hypothetical protein WJX84_004314 [Apatococcus fuscideae]|uniref:Dystroglycan-type cadherin-like domain-containing protein n=1 Tax=Apatococcus fuscideae TaxID=2026836 RepID=A0AAW1T386_9CHLO
MFPSIEIADGQPLQYTLPGSVFQLNKPYGQLSYGAQQLASMPLPAWLRFDESGLLSGTPQEGSDATYNLTITATDTDGSRNATFLMLYVKAPCPSGLYRHFRVQISAANNGKTAICSILWGADQPRVVHFPTAEATTAGAVAAPAERAFNVSCGRALPGYDADAIEHQPAKAFQQLLNDKVTCDPWPGNSWTANPGDYVAVDMGTSNSDPQMAVIWQYISISSATPVSAIGEYVIKVVAQNPGSNLTSSVLFNLNVVDYYQLTLSLALAGISPSGLTISQQHRFQAGISTAFGLDTAQIFLPNSSGPRRTLLQASTYVLRFSITGLNGKATAEALAQSLEVSVSNGQLNRQLAASGLTTQVALAAPPQAVKASEDSVPAMSGDANTTPDQSPAPTAGSARAVQAPSPAGATGMASAGTLQGPAGPDGLMQGAAMGATHGPTQWQQPAAAAPPASMDALGVPAGPSGPSTPAAGPDSAPGISLSTIPGQPPLPPNAAPAVTAASIPVVSIPFAVPDLSIATFTDDIKQALVDAITASVPATSNVQVYITNIRDGSLLFDTVVLFLDGDSGAAQTLTNIAAASTAAAPSPAGAGPAPARSGGFILPAALANAIVPTVPIIAATANPNAISSPPPPPVNSIDASPISLPNGPSPSMGPTGAANGISSGPLAAAPSISSNPTAGFSASPSPPPPPSTVSTSNVASPSTAASIPIVTFTASLSSFTMATFTIALGNEFKQAIIAKLQINSDVTVDISNLRDGSLLLDTAITFLNGDSISAGTLTSTLSTNAGIQSIFDPNGPLGAVGVTNLKQSTIANPNTAHASGKLNAGEIAGIAIGSMAGLVLAVLLIALITMLVIKRIRRANVTVADVDASSPELAQLSPGGSVLFKAFRKKRPFQPVPLANTASPL